MQSFIDGVVNQVCEKMWVLLNNQKMRLNSGEEMHKMKMLYLGLALTMIHAETAFAKEPVVNWLEIGKQANVSVEWASNVVTRDASSISTLMRMRYAREDQAPNNRRFNRETVGLDIRCSEKTYVLLGHTYSMGNRDVYSESLGISEPAPYHDTFVQKIAERVCAA
jgi:hypothetical protein